MEYNLEISKAVNKIKKSKAKLVCIQLPDGLKKYAGRIQKQIESRTNANIIIWIGSCYGACDTPVGLERLNFDLLIQWGHSEWKQ